MDTANNPIRNEAVETQSRTMQQTEIDLLDVLIALARYKRLIVTMTIGSAVLATAISLLIPNRYTATTRILPPQQEQSAAGVLMNQLAGGGLGPLAAMAGKDLGLKNPNDIYVGLIKSRTVEDALISQFDLGRVYRDKKISDIRKDLENASNIASSKEGLIEISVEDKNPQRAAAMANTYVEQLRQITQHLAVTEASQRRLFFEKQVQQAKEDLADAETALKNTEQKTGMIQLDAQAKTMIEAVGKVRAEIAAKEVELQAMKSFATDQNPEVSLRERELAGMREQLAGLEKQTPAEDDPPMGDPMVVTGKIPAASLEYANALREVKYRETIFELLAKQFEAAKLDEAKEAAIVQVVDPAVQPDKKSSPKRSLIIPLSTVLGMLMAIAYVFVAEVVGYVRRDSFNMARINQLRSHFVNGGQT